MSLIGEGTSIDDHIEECINKQEPLVKVLRLLCLSSLVNNGLKPKQLEFFKREILQVSPSPSTLCHHSPSTELWIRTHPHLGESREAQPVEATRWQEHLQYHSEEHECIL